VGRKRAYGVSFSRERTGEVGEGTASCVGESGEWNGRDSLEATQEAGFLTGTKKSKRTGGAGPQVARGTARGGEKKKGGQRFGTRLKGLGRVLGVGHVGAVTSLAQDCRKREEHAGGKASG